MYHRKPRSANGGGARSVEFQKVVSARRDEHIARASERGFSCPSARDVRAFYEQTVFRVCRESVTRSRTGELSTVRTASTLRFATAFRTSSLGMNSTVKSEIDSASLLKEIRNGN